MSVSFKTSTNSIARELGRCLWQSKVGLLLRNQVIDDLVLALELNFDDLKLGA